MNELKLKKLIVRHKKLVSMLGNEFKKGKTKEEINLDILTPINKLAKEICIVISGFKCQKEGCGETNGLELHHLISKTFNNKFIKEYMDYGRYLTCRHYFGNIIVLCTKHHLELHPSFEDDNNREQINQEYIDNLKVEYLDSQNNGGTKE